eukprot:CAMPEP_0172440164 /NCGR_PEP_ID=MMETSP1065-20121228/892_1 /TAXON_ID=265537 /ORGANISM="Amphiprora paludosa, Strain CCMP125" /LENGTH=1410 /DNA_ID=CAMNT_0013188947 /DNA_START=89 /DNA_END=4321 /DNA_ORIENTATION=-
MYFSSAALVSLLALAMTGKTQAQVCTGANCYDIPLCGDDEWERAPITPEPTSNPTLSPTISPSAEGEKAPSETPSDSPVTSEPTDSPTKSPTKSPTESPVTSEPTNAPVETPTTQSPTKSPTESPVTSEPTDFPSESPVTSEPTDSPSESPVTSEPTDSPSESPVTSEPTKSPTTGAPTRAPVAPVAAPITGGGVSSSGTPAPTGSPIEECLVYYESDFSTGVDGWNTGSNVQHIPPSGSDPGSIRLKDSDNYSSYIEKVFGKADIGHMDYQSEVTVTFDFCAVSLEADDSFVMQFAIDDGTYFTFAEYEAGDEFDPKDPNNANAPVCQTGVSETFFLPAGSEQMKIKFAGGVLSQWDSLYLSNVSVQWCKISCTPKPLDICVAIDTSGSVCTPGSSPTNCGSCNCRSGSEIFNGNTDECCTNFVDTRDFAANFITQANNMEYDQSFSIVSFATESGIRVPNGYAGLTDAGAAINFLSSSFAYTGGWTITGDAIADCHASLDTSSNEGKVMVLITDGTPTRGGGGSNGSSEPQHKIFATAKADAAKASGITIIPVVIAESVSANAPYLKTLGSDPGMMVEVNQFSALDSTLDALLGLIQCTAGQDDSTPAPSAEGEKAPSETPSESPETDEPSPTPTASPIHTVTTPAPTKLFCETQTFDFSSGSAGWSKGNSAAASWDSTYTALELTHSDSDTTPTWTSPMLSSTMGKVSVTYDFQTVNLEDYQDEGFDLEYSLDNGGSWTLLQTHRTGDVTTDVSLADDDDTKTGISAEFDVPSDQEVKIRFKGRMGYSNDKAYIQKVVVEFCTSNSPSPTTSTPSVSPTAQITATPTGDCVEFHKADFSSASDMDGWTSGMATPHSTKYGGSLLLKDSTSSSYIEQEFDESDIGNMQYHSEVSFLLEYCAESMEDGDSFTLQFAVDGGPFYTFAEFEAGPDFSNDCGVVSQNFFLPAGSTTVKVRIVGGDMTQNDFLYIKNLSLFWCQASCIDKTVDVCIAVDRSGSVCSPLNDVQGCDSCGSCKTDNSLTDAECCDNWMNNVDFAKGVIDLLSDGRADQFSVVSFAGSSSTETSPSNGRVSAGVAKTELDGITYSGGWTITGQAIADCKATLMDSTNDPIIVLVTDGTPTRGGGGEDGSYQRHKDWAKQKADAAKAAGIKIIPVMVTTGHSNMNFLKTDIASDPGMAISVTNFDDLSTVMDDVVGMVQCTADRDPTLGLTAAPVKSPVTGAPVVVNTARQAATCEDVSFDNFSDCWSSHNNGGDYWWGGNWRPGTKDYCESWCKTTSDCPGNDSKCIRLRDGNGWESGMKSSWVYVDGYSTFEICFEYRAKDYEPGEYWLVREQSYRNGCYYGFKDVKTMTAATDFDDNTTVDGQMCVTANVASGITWMQFAITSNGDHSSDELFIDNVSLKKCSA